MSEVFGIYLKDHLAGAQVAINLLEAMCDQHPEERYRKFAGGLLPEIRSDEDKLRRILAAVGEQASSAKNAGGWLLEKLARVKLEHTRSRGLEMIESLEVLSLGIAGKRSLWRALDVLSAADSRLSRFDFANLLNRAEDQLQIVENERISLVSQFLAPNPQTR